MIYGDMKHLVLPKENKTNMTIDEILLMNKKLLENDTEEIWKPVIFKTDKSKLYSVSSKGRIRNNKRGIILSQHIESKNDIQYYCVTLYFHNKNDVIQKRNFPVHQLVAHAFCPWRSKENAEHIHHIDPNKSTWNDYRNLIFVSVLEHVMIHDGLDYYNPKKGEYHPFAKYSNTQIENLCMLMEENKLSNKELSAITGVDIKNINEIRAGKHWKHISKKYKIPKLRNANRYIKFYNKYKLDTVCELILKGLSNKDISEITGIKHDTISNIRHGKSHRDLCIKYGIIKI